MNISRDWATPVTIGAFGLMAVTGILMFFHLETGLNKAAHEWLSWLMVGGVVAHAYVNWAAFKRYFLKARVGQGILLISALVIAGSFFSFSGKAQNSLPPPVLAMHAVSKAPLTTVALLADQPVDQLIKALQQAGIAVKGPTYSLDSAIANNRGLESKAMRVIFGDNALAKNPSTDTNVHAHDHDKHD